MKTKSLVVAGFILLLGMKAFSQDPNFHIYLCFGQSNMEGQGAIEPSDANVNERFQVINACNSATDGRAVGGWYTATPPLFSSSTGLSPADYFGRIMVANLPDSIKIGVVPVAVAGCKIELFSETTYAAYKAEVEADVNQSWMVPKIASYGGNPYGRLVTIAKQAQEVGVIKGILLHQGESNANDSEWPSKVKAIYDSLISQLSLDPAETPLLAGEALYASAGGVSSNANTNIRALPNTLSNSYVISAEGLSGMDQYHFNSEGYREIGRRYAMKMLEIKGITPSAGMGNEQIFLEAECGTVGSNWRINEDIAPSNKAYAMPQEGTASKTAAPTDVESQISMNFSITNEGLYAIYARVKCPTSSSDAVWVKLDDEEFQKVDGMTATGYKWAELTQVNLTAGNHVITVAICDENVKLDKIHITDLLYAIASAGDEAANLCTPQYTVGVFDVDVDGYSLNAISPNVVSNKANISFTIPEESEVSLKVLNINGIELGEITNDSFTPGSHAVEYNPENLSAGTYYIVMTAGKFYASKEFIIAK